MKRPDERSRPAGNGPAKKSLDDTPSVSTADEIASQLAACSGPDDPMFKAATLLSAAWEPALNRSYRFGYENGYAAGFYAAEQDMAAAWAKAARPIREVLKQPTRAELARRRREVTL